MTADYSSQLVINEVILGPSNMEGPRLKVSDTATEGSTVLTRVHVSTNFCS